jgi:hypothetical protein
MKKFIRFLLSLLILLSALFVAYRYFLSGRSSYQSIYLVPKNAALIVESEAVFNAWEKVIHSSAWKTISQIESLKELNDDIQYLDSLLSKKMFLFRLLGKRKVTMSIHEYQTGKYDILYIVNLGKVSRLRNPEKLITSLFGRDYPITKRTYKDLPIYEMFDQNSGEMYIFSFIHDKLILSINYQLIEASIDEMGKMTIGRDLSFIDVSKRISGKGLFTVYLCYHYLPSYLESLMGKSSDNIKNLRNQLAYSAFSFTISPSGLISLEGYTSVNDTVPSIYSTILETGNGGMQSPEIIPDKVASFIKISLENVHEYFRNSLIKLDPEEYQEYDATIRKVEEKYKINLDDNILNWIDDEIVLLQTQPSNLGRNNEFAAIIKARNKRAPERNLEYIGHQIEKNSPVKIKKVDYEGYTITYISFPGLVKLFFGRMLEKIEKPYYTQIDEYVIFSNHPQTLKNIIDEYHKGNTLTNSEDYDGFVKQFSHRNSAFMYLNIPVMYSNLREFVGPETWQKLSKNKSYITHFPQAGIQLDNTDNLLHLIIKAQYQEITENFSRVRYDEDSFVKLFSPDAPENVTTAMRTNWFEPEIVINDLDDNKVTVFYDDGTVHYEVELKNGLKHGNFREYFPDGTIRVRGKFKADKPDGNWKLYDEEEKVIEEKYFSNGKELTE